VPSVSQRVYAESLPCGRGSRGAAVHAYDLRRSFANWMEAAGIPRTRRKLYMGHGAKDISTSTSVTKSTAFLADDGRKLRAWIDRNSARTAP
jgi:integrase